MFGSEIDVARPEVAFEKYIYMAAFRHEEVFGDIDSYLEYFRNWTDSTPSFEVWQHTDTFYESVTTLALCRIQTYKQTNNLYFLIKRYTIEELNKPTLFSY